MQPGSTMIDSIVDVDDMRTPGRIITIMKDSKIHGYYLEGEKNTIILHNEL